MKKYLFIVLFVASIPNLKSDEIIIYSAGSAEYYASGDGQAGCCNPGYFGSHNEPNLYTRHCQWWSQYSQCGVSGKYALWRFDLTEIPENSIIINANILAQGGGNWIQSFMSISDDTGSISIDMASYLINGGDWSLYGQGVITSPVNEIIPNEIINSSYDGGQFCLMFRFYDGYITNYGVNSPRLVITYDLQNIMGDINDDGMISILDIVVLVNSIFNEELGYNEIADVNFDNKINIFDLIHLTELL